MRIRKAGPADFAQIIGLAKGYGLNYFGMEADNFWVAEEGLQILGIIGLRRYRDCQELCSLGVIEEFRKRGIGTKLVFALLAEVKDDVYLATIIPRFFEKLGFKSAEDIPPSMVKTSDWCEGCTKERCVVMVRKAR